MLGIHKGAEYNGQSKPEFNPTLTFAPSENVRQINGGKDREGLEEGAY